MKFRFPTSKKPVGKPHRIDQFYDRRSRVWITRVVDDKDNQIGDAETDGTKEGAKRAKEMLQRQYNLNEELLLERFTLSNYAKAWIDPTGKIHEVDTGAGEVHVRWLKQNWEEFFGKGEPSERELSTTPYRRGWLRLRVSKSNNRTTLLVDGDEGPLRKLFRVWYPMAATLLRREGEVDVYIDVENPKGGKRFTLPQGQRRLQAWGQGRLQEHRLISFKRFLFKEEYGAGCDATDDLVHSYATMTPGQSFKDIQAYKKQNKRPETVKTLNNTERVSHDKRKRK